MKRACTKNGVGYDYEWVVLYFLSFSSLSSTMHYPLIHDLTPEPPLLLSCLLLLFRHALAGTS